MAKDSKDKKPSAVVSAYLTAYNFASFVGWASVLVLTIKRLLDVKYFDKIGSVDFSTIPPTFPEINGLYREIGFVTLWVQTGAVLEIVHSLLGLVRSPFLTTFLQVMSRIYIVWGILYLADDAHNSFYHAMMCIAWCCAELPRYLFYTLKEITGDANKVPFPLFWLRYSVFAILYPVGISGEWIVSWLSLGTIEKEGKIDWALGPQNPYNFVYWHAGVIYFVLFVLYPFGSYMMYTHMLKTRSKTFQKRADAIEAAQESADAIKAAQESAKFKDE